MVLGGENASLLFHCKPPMELVFFHWVEYTLQVWTLKPLVLCHLWDCYGVLIALVIALFAAMPLLGKQKIFLQKSDFPDSRTCLGWVLRYWSQLPKPSAQRAFGREELHQPSYKRRLCMKRTRVAFHCKAPFGLVFIHWVVSTLLIGSFKPLVFLSFVRFLYAIFALASLCATYPHLWNEHYLLPNKPSPENKSCLEWVSSFWSPLKTTNAHWALGRLGTPSANLAGSPSWQKDRGSFSLKIPVGLMFIHWAEFILHIVSSKPFIFSFARLLWITDCPCIVMRCFALFWKRAKFGTKKSLLWNFPSWHNGKESY